MNIDEARLILASSDFEIGLPAGWNREKDREYYTEWYDSTAGFDHALELIMESNAALDATVRSAIGFLHGGINPEGLEVVDVLSFQERIEVLRKLIHRVPPSGHHLVWLTQSLAKCLTADSHRGRIMSAVIADPENEPFFYELQQLTDWILTVEIDLRESMEQYEHYQDYAQALLSDRSSVIF